MTEDTAQKERRLAKELAQVRSQRAAEDRTTRISRDYSIGGLPPDTSHKPARGSADTPDVVQLPLKKRRKSENKW
jgi:hypothetical protein|tara:strand:- start:1542 stop:1766 length:225 start_codon:yes stop_codon:yes gene_type:complete